MCHHHRYAQLCVLHLAIEPLTARDEDRYWPRIAIFAYHTCIRRPVTGVAVVHCHNVQCGKTRIVWLPNLKKKLERYVYSLRQNTGT